MDNFEAQVISITPVHWPDGTLAVSVVFGNPVAVQQKTPDQKNVVHVQLPGQLQNQAVPLANRVILLLTQKEWDQLQHKPTYGEAFTFASTKNGFKFERAAKN
ncbi:hypothetical protein HY572_00905 [Candidatus Micrarchaeota archaeon]|nr:hypothetical protein [Candidatus Micrarchaeota archaeon]